MKPGLSYRVQLLERRLRRLDRQVADLCRLVLKLTVGVQELHRWEEGRAKIVRVSDFEKYAGPLMFRPRKVPTCASLLEPGWVVSQIMQE